MTRQEFCELLVNTKNNANVPLKEALEFATKLTLKKISVIESGEVNFYLSDAMTYLQMCKKVFEFGCHEVDWVNTIDDVRTAMITERNIREWSIEKAAKCSGVSSNIISAFELGKCDLKIDTFLQLVNAYEISIET